MNDLHVRSAIPEDALKIARLWIQCTLELASLEPVYTPAVDQEKLADILNLYARTHLRRSLSQPCLNCPKSKASSTACAKKTFPAA